MRHRAALIVFGIVTAVQAQTLDEGPADGSFVRRGTVIDYTTVGPSSASYESGWQQRVNMLLTAKDWDYTTCNWGDPDAGKRAWPQLLADMYLVKDSPTDLQKWIAVDGNAVLTNQYNNTSTFNKPFSCPGYTLYYFKYKGQLPQTQIDAARSMVTTQGFAQMSRADGQMDPIYDQSEKNSENFNWMARLMGYLWAYELNDAPRKTFFTAYVDNWVHALYNTHRVEWNSNVYWGYCWNPCLVLYQFAQNGKAKKQARAAMDWQLVDLALHYIDGVTTGADVRAKEGSYKAFPGTSWLYGYLYFGDQLPSYSAADAKTAMAAQNQMCGFPPYSTYRPPQAVLDIAHRAYQTPIELHGAKPFYQGDYDDYAHWKGADSLSRRFDFETLYLEKNYTLSSVATNYPSGVDCFWEQSVWKMAVKGSGSGAVQIFGNASGYVNAELSCGRSPYEEIGQYRTCMMRLIKGAAEMWVAFPASMAVAYDGNSAYADLGSGVYVALTPWNTTGTSSVVYSRDSAYRKYSWSYSTSSLGALVLEAGTVEEYGSYAAFRTAVRSGASLSSPGTDQVQYTSPSGRTLKMQFMPTLDSYTYWYGVANQPSVQKTIAPAGVTPKVWCDGQYLDFSKWQTWHVTYGENIVEQNWGSGAMSVQVGGRGLQIIVDPATAEVEYRSIAPGTGAVQDDHARRREPSCPRLAGSVLQLPAASQGQRTVQVVSPAGRIIVRLRVPPGIRTVRLPGGLSGGTYLAVQGIGDGRALVTPMALPSMRDSKNAP